MERRPEVATFGAGLGRREAQNKMVARLTTSRRQPRIFFWPRKRRGRRTRWRYGLRPTLGETGCAVSRGKAQIWGLAFGSSV